MAEQKKIIIIGAGIAGLAAGVYAQQKGFHATIYEKNPNVGGLCCGWERQNFKIDGCIHWLTGTKENTFLNEMWKNIGAFKQEDILYLDSWGSFNYQGTTVTLWRDLDRAEKEWCEISPADKKMIHRFFKMVRDFTKVELPLDLPFSMMMPHRLIALGLKILSIWPSYLLTMVQTCEKFAKKFKSPAIRFALETAQPGPGNLFSMIYSYATTVIGDGGIPKGGSQLMVDKMKDKFISLGGTLKLNSPVERIEIEHGVATGVYCKGKLDKSDYLIACCDTNYVMHGLLFGQYKLKSLEKRYAFANEHATPTCCYLSFKVKDIPDVVSPFSFETEPFNLAGSLISHLTIRSYAFDDTFTKDGYTLMTVLLDQYSYNYSYWKSLHKDLILYRKEKERLASIVKARIIHQFPELVDKITLLDITTPYTYHRYTNAARGAYMPFMFTHRAPMYTHNGTLKGLKHFYLSGQWMQGPGGLPIAMSQGKFSIQRICKKENISYIFSPKRKRINKNNSKKIVN